jgi:hypothetical protein
LAQFSVHPVIFLVIMKNCWWTSVGLFQKDKIQKIGKTRVGGFKNLVKELRWSGDDGESITNRTIPFHRGDWRGCSVIDSLNGRTVGQDHQT